MGSFLNQSRPPVFCPGCSHQRITHALDQAFDRMGLDGSRIAIVSDIGCSGLFDTFFETHAFHGLHGRALTYAAGLKLARPELTVIVTMGDGGQGIGGAHLLAACRRNLDLTLLVLNNFNFGMTGGQFSATTPEIARIGSGFLNQLERPMDICRLARTAGAPHVVRSSAYSDDLVAQIESAIRFKGFSVFDIWGICPGRYTKRNRLTPADIEDALEKLPDENGFIPENEREEFGAHYRQLASKAQPMQPPVSIEATCRPPEHSRREVIILGSAGQRVLTAGEILCLAGMSAGLNVTQKNDYHITVLRGPSISEVIVDPNPIGFTGIDTPDVILAIGQDGVDSRKHLFESIGNDTLIIRSQDVDLPEVPGPVWSVDFKTLRVKPPDRALASLALMAATHRVISLEMLHEALSRRFSGDVLASSIDGVKRMAQWNLGISQSD